MDKGRVTGAFNKAKAAVKNALGRMTGDTKARAEGKADKAKGTAQSAVGGAKDAARDAAADKGRT